MHVHMLTLDFAVEYLTEEAVLREAFSDHGIFFYDFQSCNVNSITYEACSGPYRDTIGHKKSRIGESISG